MLPQLVYPDARQRASEFSAARLHVPVYSLGYSRHIHPALLPYFIIVVIEEYKETLYALEAIYKAVFFKFP